MKSIRSFLVPALFAAVFAMPTGFAAKTPIDFSQFKGTYTSTYLVSDSSSTGTGNATVQVTSKKKGAALVIRISGFAVFGGSTVPLLGTLKIDQKKVTSDSILLGFSGQPAPTLPARYSGRKNSFRFTSIVAPGATFGGSPIFGSINFTLRFGKRSIALGGSGVISTGSTFSIIVQINGTKKK